MPAATITNFLIFAAIAIVVVFGFVSIEHRLASRNRPRGGWTWR